MRFSGHETFCVREGWLYKGLRLLIEEPEKFHHEHTADFLGVGSNMARSIRHWLLATGLAQTGQDQGRRLALTDLGQLIFEYDPYFVETGTWWLLHINLVSRPVYSDTWHWFFNSFNLNRFDRPIVVENLRQYIQLSKGRLPSMETLERDVACLLSSYSRNIPPDNGDPEEARDCPLRDLRLLSHFRSSGFYQIHHCAKPIHPCVFGYCVSKAYDDAGQGAIAIPRLLREPSGPGRSFVLDSESLFETLMNVMKESDEIHIQGHAGQRAVTVPRRNPMEWAKALYQSKGAK